MNVTAADSTKTKQSTADTTAVSNAEKTSSAAKTEEKKEEKTSEKSEFKKVMEEQQTAEKTENEKAAALQEQQVQNPNQNPQIDNQYAEKFGFDTISSKGLQCSMNYDTVSISADDAKFFADLVENKQFAIQQNGEQTNLIKFADEIGPTYKAQQTSSILTDLISKAYNEQKPVRIDFDNNVSVILKIDAKGKVSAEFIPGDKAVEAYLKSNISSLKQRFDDQNLPYNDLLYRQSNNQNQRDRRQNQQQNKGE